MKKPRIEAFQPDAAPKLGSPMDDLPAIKRPTKDQGRSSKPKGRYGLLLGSEQSSLPQQSQTARTPVGGYARTLARIPFEIYQDQHATLKGFSLEEKSRGEKGSMSQMVREALDTYIAKRRG
jgi:hypothetical protein